MSESNPTLQTTSPEITRDVLNSLKNQTPDTESSCLVQIYPTDVVAGIINLQQDEIIIGREGNVDVALPDSSVSRRHACIRREDHQHTIIDLNSTNGTLVDDADIKQCVLKSGNTIRIGTYLFKYLEAGSVETQYHEIVYSALTRDALTGAMNRRYLMESLDRSIATAQRRQEQLAVVMIDIDHFKSINDTHGHLVGDEVLKTFGSRLIELGRNEDLFGRYGGEEFCMVLPSSDAEQAKQAAERCREIIAGAPFDTHAGPLPITASFGVVATTPQPNETPQTLIDRADRQLYRAKEQGRNQVCVE